MQPTRAANMPLSFPTSDIRRNARNRLPSGEAVKVLLRSEDVGAFAIRIGEIA
jgi:hypothetical protein